MGRGEITLAQVRQFSSLYRSSGKLTIPFQRLTLWKEKGESQWAYEPMLDELTCQVGRELGEADGVIVFDPSGFEKDGKKPVGVQRLDCAAVA